MDPLDHAQIMYPPSKKFSKAIRRGLWERMSPSAPCPSPGEGNLVSSTSSRLKPAVEPGCWSKGLEPSHANPCETTSRSCCCQTAHEGCQEGKPAFCRGVFKINFRAHGKGTKTIGGRMFLKHLLKRETLTAAIPEGTGYRLQLGLLCAESVDLPGLS